MKTHVRLAALGLLAVALVAGGLQTPPAPAEAAPGDKEWKSLFNGKDLDGWEGHEKYWSVQDGVIIGKNTKPVPVSTYLLTKRKFSDFRLVCDFKLARSEMHSGIALWGRIAPEKGDPYTYAGHLVMFPSGYGFYDLYGRNMIHNNAATTGGDALRAAFYRARVVGRSDRAAGPGSADPAFGSCRAAVQGDTGPQSTRFGPVCHRAADRGKAVLQHDSGGRQRLRRSGAAVAPHPGGATSTRGIATARRSPSSGRSCCG